METPRANSSSGTPLAHRAGVGAAHQHNHLIDKKGHDRDINHIRDTKQDDLSLEFLEQIQNAFVPRLPPPAAYIVILPAEYMYIL